MRALILNGSPVRDGATAAIAAKVAERLAGRFGVTCACIDDYRVGYCRGCRACHATAQCVLDDDVPRLMAELDRADVIVVVSPSYWADIPGQLKAFIDRCTPWCDTHEPHATIAEGKRGYVIALRTGPSMRECDRVIGSVEHFYGHLGIQAKGRLGLCAVASKEDIPPLIATIDAFADAIA